MHNDSLVATITKEDFPDGSGISALKIPFHGEYREYKDLPKIIEFQDRLYGKSCFNTDLGFAVYRTDHVSKYAKIILP